ncbi:MAG: YtxH domain-containing protein [Candidatus Cyclobacteriaceae bacterium M2_1C_046]
MEDNGKLFIGLLAGLGLGTVLGILIAPDKGTETYKKVEKAVRDAADDLMALGEEATEEAEEVKKKATKSGS